MAYEINLSDGVTQLIVPELEVLNGIGVLSTPRLIQNIVVNASSPQTVTFTLNGDVTFPSGSPLTSTRFRPGDTFFVERSALVGSPAVPSFDGQYQVVSSTVSGSPASITEIEAIPLGSPLPPLVVGLPYGQITYATPADEFVTSLELPGRGSLNYGELLLTNSVHILENFASDTAPNDPLPGQEWWNITEEVMYRQTSSGWSSSVNIGTGSLLLNDPGNPNGPAQIEITADDESSGSPFGSPLDLSGLRIRPTVDPNTGDPILRVTNASGSSIFEVQLDLVQLGSDLNVSTFLITSDSGNTTLELDDTTTRLTGAPSTGGIGANIEINAGTSTLVGGNATVRGGNGTSVGGNANMSAGSGGTGNGGQAQINGGASTDGTGGDVRITSGSSTNGQSGDIEFIVAAGSTTGAVVIQNVGQTGAVVPLHFQESGATNDYVALQAPSTITTSRTWILPQDDPTLVANQFLTTDSSGVLSFAPPNPGYEIQAGNGGSPGGSPIQLVYTMSNISWTVVGSPPSEPANKASVIVFVDGLKKIVGVDYDVTGSNEITFKPGRAPTGGEDVEFYSFG